MGIFDGTIIVLFLVYELSQQGDLGGDKKLQKWVNFIFGCCMALLSYGPPQVSSVRFKSEKVGWMANLQKSDLACNSIRY